MLPWIEPDRWPREAKALIAEAEPLIEALEDAVGQEVWGSLGGLTDPERKRRFRAENNLLDLLDVEAELLAPHWPLIARVLGRLASSAPRGRHLAAMALMQVAEKARTSGRQTELVSLDWLEGWARSPLSSMWPFADAMRVRLGGPTRPPSYAERWDFDLFSDYMERADKHEVAAPRNAPVSLRFVYDPADGASLVRPEASWRTSGRLEPEHGGMWFRVRRCATWKVIGHAGLVMEPDGGARLEFAFEPVPRRHDYGVEIIATLARHAFQAPTVPWVLAGAGEAEAFAEVGFREVLRRPLLGRAEFNEVCALRGPPNGSLAT